MTETLEAGVALDRRVVSAIGWEDRAVTIGAFHPSTDLNAAFSAAEKVSRVFRVTRDVSGAWDCKLSPEGKPWMLIRASTPAMAICEAILRLKERS